MSTSLKYDTKRIKYTHKVCIWLTIFFGFYIIKLKAGVCMENFKILKIESKSMVTKDGLQRVDIDYKSKATVALYLSVYDGETEIVKDILLRCTSGEQKVCVLVPVTDRDFNAKWVIKDECGNVVDSLNAEFKKPRNWTFYVMISSHTDIGLHNSQYYQRYMSEKFLDKAMELCDETDNRTENNRYRYTMEGTWFWNNYGKDRGIEKAKKVVNNYIKNDKIGICGGVAGNMIELYGLEEMCRSTYEKERLKKEWNVDTETICMIDNNGLPWSMVAPYAEAGYKNLIFAPNQWAPINSTIWEMDASKYTPANNPNANGGGSRIDVRYDSELPMVFYWQGKNENEKILVWCSTQYDAGGSAFNLVSYQGPNGDGVKKLEDGMAKQLPLLEEKYPYDIWFFACYSDDQEPNINLTNLFTAFNEKWDIPKIRTMGNPDLPFNILREKFSDKIPVLKGDITGGWYRLPLTTAELTAQKFSVDRKLPNAEKWSTIATLTDENYEYPAEDFRRAWDYLLWNDEHSYGASGYRGRRVYETWMQHRDWIDKAEKTAETEKDNALNTIKSHINSDCESMVVFNPTAQKRTELIEDNGKYALKDIVPFGYTVVSKDEFCDSEKTIKETDAPKIENKYYIVSFSDNGSIKSVFDKELNKELLKENAEFDANELVYTKDNHISYSVPEKAKFTLITEKEKATVVVNTNHKELGAEIETTVSILNYEKRIEIDNKINHAKDLYNNNRYYRYGYYAFPFDVENAKRYCNLNGCVAEYGKDITGHGTDTYMAAHEWCCAENDDFGVALLQLDSQLIEFDKIHPDKTDYKNLGDGSEIYSHIFCDWLQMHVPGGEHLNYRFRYAITSYNGSFENAKIPQMAERFANPVDITEIGIQKGILPEKEHSFMETDEDLRFLCLKRADDGKGIIARFFGEENNAICFDNLSVERASIDELPAKEENLIHNGFLTYRIGKDELNLKVRKIEEIKGENGIPAPIGSFYTGLITEPKAACGEHSGHLYLEWGQNMEPDLSHYKLYRSEEEGFIPSEETFVCDVLPVEYCVGLYEDLGLKVHTKYYYRVCAVNKNGVCGEMSKEFSAFTKES